MKLGSLVTGQSGGATAVINSTLNGVVNAGRESGAFGHIWGMRFGIEGLLNRDYVDLGALPPSVLEGIGHTPSAALGTSRRKTSIEDLDLALTHLDELNATALVLIGGNDSADTAHRLHIRAEETGRDLRVVLAPKTVDNDLPETDHTPGYGSIARYLANAVRDATYDSLASPRLYPVKFIEVMGRDDGWVPASTALAFGDDEQDILPAIFLPERPPTTIDSMLEEIAGLIHDRGFVVAVIPETLRNAEGQLLVGGKSTFTDSFGHPYHESPAVTLTRLVTEHLGLHARFERPGTASRMSVSLASPVDIAEAYQVGLDAVRLALSGESDKMIRIIRVSEHPYRSITGSVTLDRIANQRRAFPDLFIGADGRSVTEAYRRYALPLLGTEPFPPYTRLPNKW